MPRAPKPDDEDVLDRVGHRVAELRAARGWTQEVFAERLGLSVQYVRTIENGSENLTLRTLAKLARQLAVRPAVLLHSPTTPPRRRGRPPARPEAPFVEVEPRPSDLYRTCVPLVTLDALAGRERGSRVVEVACWVAPSTRAKLTAGMFVAPVVGDSMEPVIASGSWGLFRASSRLAVGRIVLVEVRDADAPEGGGTYLLKRVERLRRRTRLVSANRDYAPIAIGPTNAERFRVVAELVEVLTGQRESA